jgi:hypothetical protein
MAQLLVDGQHVVPTRATGAGFDFKHPNLGEALRHLLGQQRPFEPARSEIYYDSEWARHLNMRKRRLNPFRA